MLTCEICGQACKTVQGLAGHRRLKHSVVSGETSAGDQSAAVAVMGEQSGDRSQQSSQQSSERSIMDFFRECHESGELSNVVGGIVRDAVRQVFEDPEVQKMLDDVWELHHRRGMDVLREFVQ